MDIGGVVAFGWYLLIVLGVVSWKLGVWPWQLLYLDKLPPVEPQEPVLPPKPRVVQKCVGCLHWASNLTYINSHVTTEVYWMNHWIDAHDTLPFKKYEDEIR